MASTSRDVIVPKKEINADSSCLNVESALVKSDTDFVKPSSPIAPRSKSNSFPNLEIDVDKSPALATVAPENDFSKPFNKASSIFLIFPFGIC